MPVSTPPGFRVGILTYHFSENFGALMQAYGLRQWFIERGVAAEFVNYHPRYVEEGGGWRNPLRPANLKSNLKIAYLRLSVVRQALFGDKEQARRFERFRREVLNVTGPRLTTPGELDDYLSSPAGRFELLVCGSDQIWNPSQQYGLDPSYFLAFRGGAQGAKRISYAPSFGRSTLDPDYADEARRMLTELDAISVREASGVAIVEGLIGRAPVCVPDPTILLGTFDALADRAGTVQPGGHVFCYALRSGTGIRDVAGTIAADLGVEILSPYNPHRRWKEIGRTIHPSPDEWAAALRGAAFVVTNSFHGTAMSLIYRRPFVTVGLSGARSGMNERSRHLLESVGLSHRFLPGGDPEAARRLLRQPIDWDAAGSKLAALQATGASFLEEQLPGQPE